MNQHPQAGAGLEDKLVDAVRELLKRHNIA
jgi:hypothetical protein